MTSSIISLAMAFVAALPLTIGVLADMRVGNK